jgi:hypothetical protein
MKLKSTFREEDCEKVTTEGANSSFRLNEDISVPETETVKGPCSPSPSRVKVNATETTETSRTNNSLRSTTSKRQHFVFTNNLELSIKALEIGIEDRDRVAQ